MDYYNYLIAGELKGKGQLEASKFSEQQKQV